MAKGNDITAFVIHLMRLYEREQIGFRESNMPRTGQFTDNIDAIMFSCERIATLIQNGRHQGVNCATESVGEVKINDEVWQIQIRFDNLITNWVDPARTEFIKTEYTDYGEV